MGVYRVSVQVTVVSLRGVLVLSSSRKGYCYPLQFRCLGSTWKPSVRVVGAFRGDTDCVIVSSGKISL